MGLVSCSPAIHNQRFELSKTQFREEQIPEQQREEPVEQQQQIVEEPIPVVTTPAPVLPVVTEPPRMNMEHFMIMMPIQHFRSLISIPITEEVVAAPAPVVPVVEEVQQVEEQRTFHSSPYGSLRPHHVSSYGQPILVPQSSSGLNFHAGESSPLGGIEIAGHKPLPIRGGIKGEIKGQVKEEAVKGQVKSLPPPPGARKNPSFFSSMF